MALKPCRECKTLVSESAKVCPRCGIDQPVQRHVSALWIIPAFFVIAVVLAPMERQSPASEPKDITVENKEPVLVREQFDYSKPVFTQNYAIVCDQGILLAAAIDKRVDHGIHQVYEAFTSIWNRSTKVKELGCEQWRGGIRVFAHRMHSPFNDFVGISLTANDGATLFTMEPHLTNSGGITESKAEQDVTPEEANRRGFDANERKDYLEAARLYRLAANQGFPDAQYNLGVLYESGAGVEKDQALARSWYLKAAEQGDTGARKALADLDSKVRPPIGLSPPTTSEEGLQVPSLGQGAQLDSPPDAAR